MAGLKQYFLDNPPSAAYGLSRQSESTGGANAAFVGINFEDPFARDLQLQMSDPLPYYGGGGNTSMQPNL